MSPEAIFTLTLLVSGITLTMGIFLVTGRWRSPVLKVYPGGGVGLIFISLGFIVGALTIGLLGVWPSAGFPPIKDVAFGFVVLALLSMLFGMFVMVVGPKRLLPRWQREELESEKDDAG